MAHRTRLTQSSSSASLDGFVATPHHDLGWLLPLGDPGSGDDALYAQVGAVATRSSATPYGEASVALRCEVPEGAT